MTYLSRAKKNIVDLGAGLGQFGYYLSAIAGRSQDFNYFGFDAGANIESLRNKWLQKPGG